MQTFLAEVMVHQYGGVHIFCCFNPRRSLVAQVGFSPHVHLILAWDFASIGDLVLDRLFCRRTGEYVSHSYEEYPPSVSHSLSAKVS